MAVARRFAFCGNRFFVLETMLARGLAVAEIAAVAGSYLEQELVRRGLPFTRIADRSQFTDWLRSIRFDILVTNGCPYRVPTDEFGSDHTLINIHPSFLPDLRGADPVPGALLFRKDSGATCHLMDVGFDTGPIISQVHIPYTDDLDAPLLYQLSFLAEKEVFLLALDRDFVPVSPQKQEPDILYYTKRAEDMEINLAATGDDIVARIRAFANRSQGARIRHGASVFRIFGAAVLSNSYLLNKFDDFSENEVVFNYEGYLVIKKGLGFLKLGPFDGELGQITVGTILGAPE